MAVIASQLLSPILWDHYAMLLLLPVAYLCASGRWWALVIPLVTATPLVGITPPVAYPICFFVALGATLWVGFRAQRHAAAARTGMTITGGRRIGADALVGLVVVAVSALIYWLANRQFEAGRGDFFYLADAFLHGRTWLDFQPGPYDVIIANGRFYVPFAPFPAIVFMPLVAVIGAVPADQLESGINAGLAAAGVGMCWMLLGRIGVRRLVDRLWLVILFGFSTQILWITTRGGVWHTGQLIATILTFACLIELWGRQRGWLIGLLAGFAFLTRAPVAFAIPFYALMLEPRPTSAVSEVAGGYVRSAVRSTRLRAWALLGLGVVPSLLVFFAYNQARFGSPFESGYGLATLPAFLEVQRALGLFAIAHIGMNIDFFLLHTPRLIDTFPFFKPDGLGLSVLITSPGLLFASLADWRRPRAWWLLGAAIAVLVPTLLYYGGGWLQYGYRYFLDSVPFVMALCGFASVRHGGVGLAWRILIVFGVAVMGVGVYWAYNL